MHKLIFIVMVILLSFFNQVIAQQQDSLIRTLKHNQQVINTTFDVDEKFYGKYTGRKSGYLILNKDGTGVYKYDNYLFQPDNCDAEAIPFHWGFIMDEEGEIISFERDYGFSFPVLYSCSGENSFQGCTKTSMVDYLLVYKNGTITVSSSDDWEKVH